MALTDILVSYWRLDEASGNAIDSHSTNDLTDNNTVGSGTGKINNGRDFELSNSEDFSKADNASLSTGDIDFTLSLWINRESAVQQGLISKFGGSTNEYGLWIWSGDQRPYLTVFAGGSGQVGWGAALDVATWYHIVAWHDSVNNQIGIVVNAGTPVTASYSGGLNDSDSDFRIGQYSGSYMDGIIDEVGFWKRVLTSDERTQLYNGGAGLSYDDFAPAGGGIIGASLIGGRIHRSLLAGAA